MKISRITRDKKKIHLKNRKKFISVIISLSLVLYILCNPIISSGSQEEKFMQVTVKDGDTLWDIARKYDPQGDIRKIVYEIKELNGLETYSISAGSLIRIPL